MKNLENFGVQEMNAREMKEVNGGFLASLIFAVILIIGAVIANNIINK